MPITPEALDFLMENKVRDSRSWYQEHKPDFKRLVLAPMEELVEELAPTVLAIDPLIVTAPKVDRTISRIYRDTRFTKDPSLYREVMWIVFMRDKRINPECPAFFFEFSPDKLRYGCGYSRASPRVVMAIRELALEGHPAFLRADAFLTSQDRFVLMGERYKRSKYPDKSESLRNWLDRKTVSVNCERRDFSLLFSPELAPALARAFTQLAPIYDLFMAARDRAFHAPE